MLLRAKMATPAPQTDPQTPREAPQGVLDKIEFFQTSGLTPPGNLLAPTRGRFAPAGGGSPSPNGGLIVYTVYTFLTMGSEDYA